jgi:hypothetical protein
MPLRHVLQVQSHLEEIEVSVVEGRTREFGNLRFLRDLRGLLTLREKPQIP